MTDQKNGLEPNIDVPLSIVQNTAGLTNDFMINTEDDLAVLYNDRSPMENHHCAALFSLLRTPEFNILEHMPKAARETLRRVRERGAETC